MRIKVLQMVILHADAPCIGALHADTLVASLLRMLRWSQQVWRSDTFD